MQIVEIFINELSWDSINFADDSTIQAELEAFRLTLNFLTQKQKNYPKLLLFFDQEGINRLLQDEYVALLEVQALKQIKTNLFRYFKNWQETEYRQQANQTNYYFLNLNEASIELVNNSSLAEIAERKLTNHNQTFLILNFSQSRFKNQNFLSILRYAFQQLPEMTHIEQLDDSKLLKKWLRIEIDWKNAIQNAQQFEKIKLCFQNSKLYNFDFDNWIPKEKYLPLTEISNQLVDDDWNNFRDNLRKNAQNKEAVISQKAKEVAIINGYDLDEQVSKLNKSKEHKREIYKAGNSRDTIYLSVDFEKGGFEICDFDGVHLGEFWFDGSQTQEADKTGKHNIQIP